MAGEELVIIVYFREGGCIYYIKFVLGRIKSYRRTGCERFDGNIHSINHYRCGALCALSNGHVNCRLAPWNGVFPLPRTT